MVKTDGLIVPNELVNSGGNILISLKCFMENLGFDYVSLLDAAMYLDRFEKGEYVRKDS